MYNPSVCHLRIIHILIQKAVAKSLRGPSPTARPVCPLKALRQTKVLKFQCRAKIQYQERFEYMIQAGKGHFMTFHDISTSMLGLCHHQFTYVYYIH